MKLINELIHSLPEGRVVHVNIGLHWTAVVVEGESGEQCGLASTLHDEHSHGIADIPDAGKLEGSNALELASYISEGGATKSSVGMATINALLPRKPNTWVNLNAEDVIAEKGVGKSVVLIGHFPFISRLEKKVERLTVLELNPQPGDHPISTAPEVIPNADVVAITSMTLLNKTLDDNLKLIRPEATVIMLGPTTPLSPILFDYGIDLLCGSIVVDIQAVLQTIRQGANFRQVHKAGVRLVSISNPIWH